MSAEDHEAKLEGLAQIDRVVHEPARRVQVTAHHREPVRHVLEELCGDVLLVLGVRLPRDPADGRPFEMAADLVEGDATDKTNRFPEAMALCIAQQLLLELRRHKVPDVQEASLGVFSVNLREGLDHQPAAPVPLETAEVDHHRLSGGDGFESSAPCLDQFGVGEVVEHHLGSRQSAKGRWGSVVGKDQRAVEACEVWLEHPEHPCHGVPNPRRKVVLHRKELGVGLVHVVHRRPAGAKPEQRDYEQQFGIVEVKDVGVRGQGASQQKPPQNRPAPARNPGERHDADPVVNLVPVVH